MKKNKHYYDGQLIVTSGTNYKWALLLKRHDGSYRKMNVGNNHESLENKKRYYSAGFGKEFAGSGLWSDQFYDPSKLIIVELEVK